MTCAFCGKPCRSKRHRFCSVSCGNKARRRPSRADRFWAKVDRRGPDECWPWNGATNAYSGHGQFAWEAIPGKGRSRLIGAHRAAWMLTHGIEIRSKKIEVCHRCDTPPCCNPRHLFIGTHADNMRDCRQKGRNRLPPALLGSSNNRAKLTDERVRELRARYAAGENLSQLSRSLGMARSSLSRIVKGDGWKHVA